MFVQCQVVLTVFIILCLISSSNHVLIIDHFSKKWYSLRPLPIPTTYDSSPNTIWNAFVLLQYLSTFIYYHITTRLLVSDAFIFLIFVDHCVGIRSAIEEINNGGGRRNILNYKHAGPGRQLVIMHTYDFLRLLTPIFHFYCVRSWSVLFLSREEKLLLPAIFVWCGSGDVWWCNKITSSESANENYPSILFCCCYGLHLYFLQLLFLIV